MKISILTPSYNQGEYLEQNILSVLNQNYDDFEHIIIDGGSTDDTISVLKKYPHLKWVSEKDEGQADALNKGLRIASGDYVGWLNSDDYYEPNIFQTVVKYFENFDADWVIGNSTYYQQYNGSYFVNKSPVITYKDLLRDPDIVRQPPAFFKKAFLEKLQGFNKSFHMVMDYDLWIRAARISEPYMADDNFAFFRIHEGQKSSLDNFSIQQEEISAILLREGYPKLKIITYVVKKRFLQMNKRVRSYLREVIPEVLWYHGKKYKSTLNKIIKQ